MNIVFLTFFYVSNELHVSIEVVYTVWHILNSLSVEKCVQQLKKTNVIGLK